MAEKVTTSFFYGGSSAPEQNTVDQLIDTLNQKVQSADESEAAAANSASQAAISASQASDAAASTSALAGQAAETLTAANAAVDAANQAVADANTIASSIVDDAAAAAQNATDSAASAALAQDWATKTSGPVAGGEYSSKYNAQQAATSATSAASSATSASGSASTATTKAGEAAASATNAASSATSAGTSATNAATSASTATTKASEASSSVSNAASSASAASTSATNAASSATSASGSAATATAKASDAAASATAAAGSATSAASSSSDALASKNAASTSASNAATSESNALTYKNSAQTSATNAATSETNAASSATSASGSASTATTQATNASNSASAAATSATNASNSASAAATSASNAATSATNASNSASAAAASAASINPADLVHISGNETITGAKTFSTNPAISSGTANGVAYLNGSKVLTTGSALTFDGTTFTSGTHTIASGNLTFTGTGNRITGDFSNATVANRVMFQNSVLNGGTFVFSIPNGTATGARFVACNSSDPTNAGFLGLNVDSTNAALASGITGTGTYLPMTFYTGGSERVRIDTSGNLGLGVTPSAWSAGGNLEMPSGAVLSASANNFGIAANAYYNAGWKYISNDYATHYKQSLGQHQWFTAPSGTAGNTISFTQAMKLDASGNLQFNSGYGSVATAYGCRAWVNFNGTGTVAIRASGNVSSITDNGVGLYALNFTTALPDTNYSVNGGASSGTSTTGERFCNAYSLATGSVSVAVINSAGTATDQTYSFVAVFR